MFNKIIQILDVDSQDETLFGYLRMIRFDIDPDQEKKPFEKNISIGENVQDAKGNPGSIGVFLITNLRFIWQLRSDNYINISVGFDSLISTQIKQVPAQWGNGFKYMLHIRAQNPSQTRYQFRFSCQGQEELKVFNKLLQIKNKIAQTKLYRCSSLAVKFDNQLITIKDEQVKNSYSNFTFYQDNLKIPCKLFVTNVRLVIIKQGQKKMNYGIVWLMMKNTQITEDDDDVKGVRIFCRGLLSSKKMIFSNSKISQVRKFQQQLKSFIEIYNKSPILGITFEEETKVSEKLIKKNKQIQQIQGTKVNLVRRKNPYQSSDIGSLQNTQFNKQIGLMMQKLPQGVSRSDLWQILK